MAIDQVPSVAEVGILCPALKDPANFARGSEEEFGGQAGTQDLGRDGLGANQGASWGCLVSSTCLGAERVPAEVEVGEGKILNQERES